MLKDDFYDIDTWDELLRLCSDYGCSVCENVYTQDERDDYINEYLDDIIANASWYDVFNDLSSIPQDGYDVYVLGDYSTDWKGSDDGDDCFEEYKDDVERWMDENDMWEYEDEDGDETVYEEEATSESCWERNELPDDTQSITELFSDAASETQEIAKTESNVAKQDGDLPEEFSDLRLLVDCWDRVRRGKYEIQNCRSKKQEVSFYGLK